MGSYYRNDYLEIQKNFLFEDYPKNIPFWESWFKIQKLDFKNYGKIKFCFVDKSRQSFN